MVLFWCSSLLSFLRVSLTLVLCVTARQRGSTGHSAWRGPGGYLQSSCLLRLLVTLPCHSKFAQTFTFTVDDSSAGGSECKPAGELKMKVSQEVRSALEKPGTGSGPGFRFQEESLWLGWPISPGANVPAYPHLTPTFPSSIRLHPLTPALKHWGRVPGQYINWWIRSDKEILSKAFPKP